MEPDVEGLAPSHGEPDDRTVLGSWLHPISRLDERNEFLQKIHPFAKYSTPENAVSKTPIALHPGAIRAIEEKGVSVPANLRP